MSREFESATPRGEHHIAAIAHLFLGEASASPTERFFTVASAARDHLAAVTSAALAQRTGLGSDRTSVLREVPGQDWSAYAYLAAADRRDVVRDFAGPSSSSRCDGGAGREVATRRRGRMCHATTATRINWFNLGPTAEELLERLEAPRSDPASRRSAGGLAEARDGLIWCVEEAAAASLHSAYRLGRLAACCLPRRVIVVVFPAPFGSGRARAAVAAERPAGGAHQHRCETLLRTAVPRIALTTVWLRESDALALPTAPGDGSPLFDRVAAALFAPCAS